TLCSTLFPYTTLFRSGGELQLFLGRGPVGVLDRDRPITRLHGQKRLAHLRLHGEPPRADRFLQILVVGLGLRDLQRPREVGPDRQRDRQPRREWLAGEVERILAVLGPQRLFLRGRPRQEIAGQRGAA